jgi:hypothetical protein
MALVCIGGAAAADGGSGTYTVSGRTYYLTLFNSGTTPWQYFVLVAPVGTTFIGGATTAGESTARCVVGQPDGLANEIECGPLTDQPSVHTGFIGTSNASGACGPPFQLDVSSTGTTPFTRVGDVTFAGANCTAVAPAARTRPAIHGTPVVGRTLAATVPTWTVAPTRVTYQWQLCLRDACTSIKGATRLTLKLAQRDAGHAVRIVATAAFSGEAASTASAKIPVRVRMRLRTR